MGSLEQLGLEQIEFAVAVHGLAVGRQGHGGPGGAAIGRRQPHPQAPLAHVEHGKDADDEQQAAQVDDALPRRTRDLEITDCP